MGLFGAILCDPPFAYRDKCNAGERGACHKYPTMSVEEIKSLRPVIDDLAAPNCALFLWVPPPLVVQGALTDILRAWAFRPATKAFVWVKAIESPIGQTIPLSALGHYTRSNSEDCWLAVRGRPRVVSHSVGQVIISPRREHSRKPDEVYRRIEQLLGNVPRVEMFARQRWPGWAQAMSNEADKFTPRAAEAT